MTRAPPRARRVPEWLLRVVAATVLTGCSALATSPEEVAEGLVHRWLTEVSDPESEDRGWAALHRHVQDRFAGQEEYVEAARGADWSHFRWSIVETTYSEDSFVIAHIAVPGGESSTPGFLLEKSLLQFGSARPGETAIVIVQDWRISGP